MSDKQIEIFDGARDKDDKTIYLIGYSGDDGEYIGNIDKEEDVEFIVHRCNMHDELVSALKPFADMHCRDNTCGCNNCIARRAILKAT